MLTSLSLIFLIGMIFAALAKKLYLPGIIGMLLAGMLLGPCGLNQLDSSILDISSDLRRMALVIILLKAGLSLDLDDLRKVGRPALLMSFLPAAFEIGAYILLAPIFFGLTLTEAAVMGSVLAAVSPAVVVPRMVHLIETKRGTKKGIPQLILAGASLDDIFVVVLFSTFSGMAAGKAASASALLQAPVSILAGITLGLLTGKLLTLFFEHFHLRRQHIRNSAKTLIVLAVAFLLLTIEELLAAVLPLSGLLAIMAMACVLRKMPGGVGLRLSQKFGKLWIAAEVLLFVLVGAAVDLRYTLTAGPTALLLILLALVIRSFGVTLSTAGTHLNLRERLFCVAAYLPKATVQAAIGSVPLAMGLPCGSLVLSVAVLAILVTAPLGALFIDRLAPRWLTNDMK
ncbi:MAG: cation:proton antiporter [Clostridia bacterium]|nr:cation:proton antiporter [Clostridia bacterium]